MHYIVMDLEWNQCADGKEFSYKEVPFEIIQFGAVKLDEKFNIVSKYDRYVKPKLYRKLHYVVEEILEITMEELMEQGSDFETVVQDFLCWCGEDYVFCTWGGTDLIELQRNMNFYKIQYKFPKPFLFYDLQKLYSLCFSDGKTRLTLRHAIEEQEIDTIGNYHSADCDAGYAAMIFKELDFEKVKRFYSVDTFRIPCNKKEEIYLNFGNYEKYISRGFGTRERAAEAREVKACKCFLCGRDLKKQVKWFATSTKNYFGLFYCEEHGLIRGRYRTKSTDDGRYYTIRIMKLTDDEGAERIRLRKLHEQEHRREIRHRGKAEPADLPECLQNRFRNTLRDDSCDMPQDNNLQNEKKET